MHWLTPEQAVEARVRLNIGLDYALRLMLIYTELVKGDPVRALVFVAAARACTQHLPTDHPVSSTGYLDDELRRPVSVSAIARSLALPVETVRRHIIGLEKSGLLSRTRGGGVMVTSQHLDTPEVEAAVKANVINMNRLQRSLAAVDGSRAKSRPGPGEGSA